jgi:hypothetical protein
MKDARKFFHLIDVSKVITDIFNICDHNLIENKRMKKLNILMTFVVFMLLFCGGLLACEVGGVNTWSCPLSHRLQVESRL